MKFVIIIPARYASTRFPGKPLALLKGRPVIEHVYRKARSVMEEVYVATDDRRISDAVGSFGGHAIMTRADHRSGTDRIKEAADKLRQGGKEFDVVINIQGDEPFIAPEQIAALCRQFDDETTQIATLGKPFATAEALESPNSPKIVTDNRGFAMYFSRSVIPHVRGVERSEWLHCHTFLKHLGVYAYRSDVLDAITALPPSPLEKAESLEQLRWLQNGYRVRVAITDRETIGIDTPEDLRRAELSLQ